MTRSASLSPDHETGPRIGPVPPEQRREALERLGRNGVQLSERQARRVSDAARDAGVDFEQLWGIFDEAGGLAAVALLVYRPGRTAMIFGSQPRNADDAATLAPLLERLAEAARPDDASLIQALVEPDDQPEIDALKRAGFERLAELQYMQRSIPRKPPEAPPLPAGIALEPYTTDRHDAFIEALEQSYIDTRDCPMLRGMRATADVLAGHMSAGRFEPELWTLVRLNGAPVGLMLLNIAEQRVMELVYLGIGPTARRMGLASGLLQRAMGWAARRSVRTMSLAVDTDNAPAMGLYQQLGFYRIARRLALVRPVSG